MRCLVFAILGRKVDLKGKIRYNMSIDVNLADFWFSGKMERLVVAMGEDEQCYHRYLDGDEKGLRELIERYADSLTLYINGYIHDIHDSEDLMLEAFARVVAKNPRFDRDGFKPYLYRTGRNLALRRSEKKRLQISFGFEDLENEPELSRMFADIAQTKERRHILHLSMEQINSDYREVLYLLYFEDLSHRQAAKIMGKTEKQIANLAYRGKLALRPILEREGIADA